MRVVTHAQLSCLLQIKRTKQKIVQEKKNNNNNNRISIPGRANTHPLFWTSSLAVQFSLSFQFLCSLELIVCLLVSRVCVCVYGVRYRATFNRIHECCVLFVFKYYIYFAHVSVARLYKIPGCCACIQIQYEFVVFRCFFFTSHRRRFLLLDTLYIYRLTMCMYTCTGVNGNILYFCWRIVFFFAWIAHNLS